MTKWQAGTASWVLVSKPGLLTTVLYRPLIWKDTTRVRRKKTWRKNFRHFRLTVIVVRSWVSALWSSWQFCGAWASLKLHVAQARAYHRVMLSLLCSASELALFSMQLVQWPWCRACSETAYYVSLSHTCSGLLYCHVLFLNVSMCLLHLPT